MLCQDGTSLDRQPHLVLCVRVYVCACVCVRACMCVYLHTCIYVWLSAKMAHLLECSVKMAHLWTDGCILCCMCVLACVHCACVRVFIFVCG